MEKCSEYKLQKQQELSLFTVMNIFDSNVITKEDEKNLNDNINTNANYYQ